MLLEKEIKGVLSLIGTEALKGTLYGPPQYLSERKKSFRRMTLEEMEHYYQKVAESQGFDVDGCDGVLEGRILPLDPHAREWQTAIKAANFAAETYYQDKRLESISLLKANRQPTCGFKYYLTFTAKNTKDQGKIQTFRAKVWRKPPGDIYELQFFEQLNTADIPSTSKDKKETVGRKKIKTDDPSLIHAEVHKGQPPRILRTYHRRTKEVDGENMDKGINEAEQDKAGGNEEDDNELKEGQE